MTIRRARSADADALSDLAHRAKAHWGYPAAWMREWDAQLTIIPGYLDLHDVFVAEKDGSIVGMCALEDRHDRWHLEHVWVEPSEHGRGVGRALDYFFRGVARNMRSTSSAGAWYSMRLEMPHTPRRPHLYR